MPGQDFYGIPLSNSAGSTVGTDELLDLIGMLKPKPMPFPLIRLGGDSDGAYLLPEDLQGVAACFSPGVNNFKFFEDELSTRFGIACHMCDKSSDLERFRTPLIDGLQTFRKLWLDVDGTPDSVSLERWIDELAPDPRDDVMLQMDIEGAEYRNILATPPRIMQRIRVLVLEVHAMKRMLGPTVFHQVLYPFFEKISQTHLCVHIHPNNNSRVFQVPGTAFAMADLLELTFLRRDRVLGPDKGAFLRPSLPHPLDIGQNVKQRTPIFMGDAWMDGPRSTESELAMLRETVKFHIAQTDAVIDRKIKAEVAAMEATMAATLAFVIGRQVARPPHQESLATAPPVIADVREIGAGKSFVVTSGFGRSLRQGQISALRPYFFHTDFGHGQGITIDLGDVFAIDSLVIENRRDGNFDRARSVVCEFSVGEPEDNGPAFLIADDRAFLDGRSRFLRIALPELRARHVRISSLANTALHFANVSVFTRR